MKLFFIILAVIVILITPIPSHSSGVCLMVMDGRECKVGWYLGDPLLKRIYDYFLGYGRYNFEGKFCGGIAANLPENQCPETYKCQLNGNYPDAGGVCVKKLFNIF